MRVKGTVEKYRRKELMMDQVPKETRRNNGIVLGRRKATSSPDMRGKERREASNADQEGEQKLK